MTRWYRQFAKLVLKLNRDEDYDVDEKKKVIGILDSGIAKIEDFLGIDNLYEPANTALIGYLNNAIRAKELFVRDKDYVVQGRSSHCWTNTPDVCFMAVVTTKVCIRLSKLKKV